MDGFNIPKVEGNPGTYVYQYVNPADVKPYWDLGKQYVFADRLFQTQGSGSFTAHQDLIAGGTLIDPTEALIDNPSNQPWGCDAPKQPPTVTSLDHDGGEVSPRCGTVSVPALQNAARPARCQEFELEILHAAAAPELCRKHLERIRCDSCGALRPGVENEHRDTGDVLTDISSGKLPAVAWVCPEFDNSDHPGAASDTGPSWVAQVVNAIGQSSYWNSTAVIVLWDDWGGFYDHVAPPQIDYQGLGFRVPMLIVSPYAKQGYVSNTRYEFGSIVKFVEDNWDLGRLDTTDVRANSIDDAFNFKRNPRPFSPLQAKYSRSFFLHQRPSDHPLDDG